MRFQVPPRDDTLQAMVRALVPSSIAPGVTYRLERQIGVGAMATTFFSLRLAPDGQSPVVMKIHRPDFVKTSGAEAFKVFCKEAVALGRLNERVPTTPFVLRLIDNGTLLIEQGKAELELPWLALEYVHGGQAGTTLTERVTYCVRETGFAFDSWRAAHAVDCLAKGLSAVHEAGIIHRDIKPDNILCCGLGEEEIFKVSDFGIARPSGVTATFQSGALGTPGYAPPELIDNTQGAIGTATDVFSLASTVFHLLTGEEYFRVRSIGDAIVKILSPERRRLVDTANLSPDLRARETTCHLIDSLLAQATVPRAEARIQTAGAFAASLLPLLRTQSWRTPTLQSRPASISLRPAPSAWSWLLRQHPTDRVIRSVGWDADGTCLAATTRGLAFWDGRLWRDAPTQGLPNPRAIRFVRRVGPARWLIACEGSVFAIYTTEGVSEVIRFAAEWIQIEMFSGELDDLAVAVGRTAEGPTLVALTSHRWMKPVPVEGFAEVIALARIDDARWLLAGRDAAGQPKAAVFAPLDWDLQPLDVSQVRAFTTCAGSANAQAGFLGGTEGHVLWIEGDRVIPERLPGNPSISAAAVDPSGGGWAAGGGKIFYRALLSNRPSWTAIWQDSPWTAPIVSLFADDSSVVGMTADGGIVEGRRAGSQLNSAT